MRQQNPRRSKSIARKLTHPVTLLVAAFIVIPVLLFINGLGYRLALPKILNHYANGYNFQIYCEADGYLLGTTKLKNVGIGGYHSTTFRAKEVDLRINWLYFLFQRSEYKWIRKITFDGASIGKKNPKFDTSRYEDSNHPYLILGQFIEAEIDCKFNIVSDFGVTFENLSIQSAAKSSTAIISIDNTIYGYRSQTPKKAAINARLPIVWNKHSNTLTCTGSTISGINIPKLSIQVKQTPPSKARPLAFDSVVNGQIQCSDIKHTLSQLDLPLALSGAVNITFNNATFAKDTFDTNYKSGDIHVTTNDIKWKTNPFKQAFFSRETNRLSGTFECCETLLSIEGNKQDSHISLDSRQSTWVPELIKIINLLNPKFATERTYISQITGWNRLKCRWQYRNKGLLELTCQCQGLTIDRPPIYDYFKYTPAISLLIDCNLNAKACGDSTLDCNIDLTWKPPSDNAPPKRPYFPKGKLKISAQQLSYILGYQIDSQNLFRDILKNANSGTIKIVSNDFSHAELAFSNVNIESSINHGHFDTRLDLECTSPKTSITGSLLTDSYRQHYSENAKIKQSTLRIRASQTNRKALIEKLTQIAPWYSIDYQTITDLNLSAPHRLPHQYRQIPFTPQPITAYPWK